MQYRPDVLIIGPDTMPVAIVQIKALPHSDAGQAGQYLRNLFSHGVVPRPRFILLVSAEAGYLWEGSDTVLAGCAPLATFSTQGILRRHLWDGAALDEARGPVLDAIIRRWLGDLADGRTGDDPTLAPLRQAGFTDAVRDAMMLDAARV